MDRKVLKARRRSISRSLLSITPENSKTQLASPLFSVLPPELRNQIFALACSQYRDTADLSNLWYPKACRSRDRYSVRTCTSLLQTCRLIYYETRVIPLQSATHYIQPSIGWPTQDHYVFHLTKAQQALLYHLHISGRDWIRDYNIIAKFVRADGMHWKKITVSKKWFMDIPHRWLKAPSPGVLPVPMPLSCREFVIELEVLKKVDAQWADRNWYEGLDKVEEVVRRLTKYGLTRTDSSYFSREPSTVERSNWSTPHTRKSDTKGAVPLWQPVECEVFRVIWRG